ncbi:MAG: DegQ family serine endoprotease [Candidatus Cloacimonetes bacterium]|nr:DegQ family serine endoprotease [Candidatus Cloacimonadota bacterium]
MNARPATLVRLAALPAMLLMMLASHAWAEDVDLDALNKSGKIFARIAKQAAPAVVYIEAEQKTRGNINGMHPFYNDPFFREFFPQREPETPRGGDETYRPAGQGSGFVYKSDGYILTNNHVVEKADRLKVTFTDGRELEATVVGTDPETDVALIKVDAKGLTTLSLGQSSALDIGDWVLAIGNPFGLSSTVTAGIVSAMGRSRVGLVDYEDFIQTDAAINPGNSGGPLLNLKGEVVGINSAIFSRSGGSVGIGFAIPVDMVRTVEEQLLADGRVTRGFLGVSIQDVSQDLMHAFELPDNKGVLIASVQEGSPADKAGLKNGDVVTSIDGHPVENASQLRNRAAMTAPGTTVNMQLRRDGQNLRVPVTVGYRDGEGPDGPLATASKGLGLTVAELDSRSQSRLGRGRTGVMVESVDQGGAADRAGLEPGDIILEVGRRTVESVDDFNKIVRGLKGDGRVLLLVTNGRNTRYLALEVGE